MMRAGLLSIVLLGASALAAPVLAAPENRGSSLSLSEAAQHVQERVGGRILAAEVVQDADSVYYEIRVLVERGRVRVYRVDPRTGKLY